MKIIKHAPKEYAVMLNRGTKSRFRFGETVEIVIGEYLHDMCIVKKLETSDCVCVKLNQVQPCKSAYDYEALPAVS